MALPAGSSRIPELLEKQGKKQVDLALYLGVSEAFISSVIAGKKKFSYERARNAAKFLKCRMEDLEVHDDEETSESN